MFRIFSPPGFAERRSRSATAFAAFAACLLGTASGEDGQDDAADDGSVVAELGELVVVGTRTERPWIDSAGSTTRVDAEELLRLGSQDLAGFSKYDPTLSLPFDFGSSDGAFAYGQSGYGSINIRGAEGNRIAIELDDIRQPPQYVSTSFDMGDGGGSGGIGRDYFDPAMFEIVEVFKGGASSLYGSDALGGVVTFATPEPETFLQGRDAGALLRGQYFSANESYAWQTGGAVRRGNTSVMLLYAGREGGEMKNNGREAPNPADFTSHAALLKAEHVHGEHAFRLALEFYERDMFTDAVSATESSFSVFTDYVHNWQFLERRRASLRWTWEPRNAWLDRLDTHAYWQHAGSRSDNESAAKPRSIGGIVIPGSGRWREQSIEFDTDIAGLTLRGMKEWGDADRVAHTLTAGLEASVEVSENRFERIDSDVGSNRVSFAPSDTRRMGAYLQDEISISRKFLITPGLRLDWQEIVPEPNAAYLARLDEFRAAGNPIAEPGRYENLSIAPRLNLAWKPREDIQVYGSYARGVRNPTAEELSMIFDHPSDGSNPVGALTLPNPGLEEEKSDAFEIGVKGEGKAGRFQVAGFYTKYRDFIENGVRTGRLDSDGRDIVTTVNRGKAEIYGFEVSGVLELGYWWQQAEGWQIGLATGRTIGNDLTRGQPINSVEPWKSVAYVGYNDPEERFGARLSGTYTAAVDRVDDTTNQTTFYRPPSWFTLDLGLWWQPTETLAIHAGVNNILDEKYWLWSSVRRGNGHLGGNATTDRSTAPGRNFSLSVTKTF